MKYLRRPLKVGKLLIDAWLERLIQLQSSHLTYYSLLVLVPIVALFLGLAEFLNVKQLIYSWLGAFFSEQPHILDYLIQFGEAALTQAHQRAVKITGMVILVWAGIKILLHLDSAINNLWAILRKPPFYRRILRYLVMLLVCPILLISSTGLVLYLTTFIKYLQNLNGFFEYFKFIFIVATNVTASLVTFFVISFLYYFIPYNRVRIRHALLAGLITSLVHQVAQLIYFSLQILVTRYNAIYGTFAAFPLFLIWLHFSWTIFFAGARLSYSFQESKNF